MNAFPKAWTYPTERMPPADVLADMLLDAESRVRATLAHVMADSREPSVVVEEVAAAPGREDEIRVDVCLYFQGLDGCRPKAALRALFLQWLRRLPA